MPGPAPAQYSPVDAFKYGWTKFTQNAGPFLLVTVLILGISLVISFGSNFAINGSLLATGNVDPETGFPEPTVASELLSLLTSMVVSMISWALGAALVRGALDVVDTGRTDLGQMFTRINWGQVILASVLVSLATTIGTILCILPGIAAAFLFMYSTVAVVDGESAIDGLAASFRFTTAHLGETILFVLLAIPLVVIAICTCGIGMLVVLPMLYIGMAYTWRVLQGRPVAA